MACYEPGMRPCFVAVAFLAMGCSSPPEPEAEEPTRCDAARPAPASIPAVEFLREDGAGGHTPLVSGDALKRHYGSQGGSHFYVYARVFSADATPWLVSAKLSGVNAAVLAQGSQGFTACAGQWIEPREVTVFLESGGDLAGTLSVTAKPQQGAPLDYEVDVTVN